MIQGKSGESQLGTDAEVTEHVMSSRGGSIHGPHEKGNHKSGPPSPMMMLVVIVVQDAVSSEVSPSSVATEEGCGAFCVKICVDTWAGANSEG